MGSDASDERRSYRRAEDRRQEIVDTVAAIIARDGFAHLTMAAVADEVGVSRQLLYRYYGGLDDLVLATARARFAPLRSAVIRRPPDTPPVRIVAQQVDLLLALPASDQRLLRHIFSDLAQLPAPVARAARQLRETIVGRWTEMISPAPERVDLVRAAVWSVFHALSGVWDYLDDGRLEAAEAREIILAFASSVGGLATTPRPIPERREWDSNPR